MKCSIKNLILFLIYFGLYKTDKHLVTGSQLSRNLTKELLADYDNRLIPNTPINVSLALGFYQLVSLDERNQIMTLNFYVKQNWSDDRLSWDPKSYGLIESIILTATSLWLPDTYLQNSGSSKIFLSTDLSTNLNAIVNNKGNVVLYIPLLRFEATCQINTRKFPFDKQICPLRIESWVFDKNQMNLNYSEPLFMLDSFIENPIWKYTGVTIEVNITSYNFYSIYYIFEFERKPLYYMVNGIFPCFILNIVSVIAFIMDYEMQVNLSLTCFLTLTVNSVVVLEDIPVQSDYLPLITLYFMVSIMLPFVSLFWFMYYESLSKKKKIPKCIEAVYSIKMQVFKTFKSCCKRKLNYPLDNYTNNDQQEEILLKKQLNLINNVAFFLFFVCVLVCDLTIWLSFMD